LVSARFICLWRSRGVSLGWKISRLFDVYLGLSPTILATIWMFPLLLVTGSFPLGGQVLLLLIHTTMVVPLLVRLFIPAYGTFFLNNLDAMDNLQLGKLVRYHLEFSALRKHFHFGLLLAYAMSFGETAAAMMVLGDRGRTLPVLFLDKFASYRFDQAALMGLLLAAINITAFYYGEKLSR
jgi:ABC-type Fe3+ transport system permease subunit